MASVIAAENTPLHTPALSDLILTGGYKEKVLSLMERTITLYFGGADKKSDSVLTTIGELYHRCQKILCNEFGLSKLIIRGSFVSHVFSGEPFSDIDIHGTIDATGLDDSSRIRRGYTIKWGILRAISEIISEKLPSSPRGSNSSIGTEQILCQEETVLLCGRGSPFNVHTIRLPGNCPVEFTLFNIIRRVEKSERNYDFNAGSLQLVIRDDGVITLYAQAPSIHTTITELTGKELTCDRPEEIERKGVCRYLAKLVIGGYHDKEQKLFRGILEGVKKRNPDKGDIDLAKEVIKEILLHFQEKGIYVSAPLLSFWLLVTEDPLLKILLVEVKEGLKFAVSPDQVSRFNALSTLVQKGKKAECCWYLLMQAKAVRRVRHWGEDALQLEIPAFPCFASAEGVPAVFLIIPIVGLQKLSESLIPQEFLSLKEDLKPVIQVEGDETKTLLQKLCHDVLIKPCLYPVLSCVIDRFGLQNQPDFSRVFTEWVRLQEQLPECNKLKLSFGVLQKLETTLYKALESPALFKEVEDFLKGHLHRPLPIFPMLKMLHQLLGEKGLCPFASILLQRIITAYTLGYFLHKGRRGPLSVDEEKVMLDFAKAHAKDLCITDRLLAYKKQGQDVLCHRILDLLRVLYMQDEVDLAQGIVGIRLCFEVGNRSEGVKFLQEVIGKEPSLEGCQIQALFEQFSVCDPLAYIRFLKENGTVIKQKTAPFFLIILSFLEKLRAKQQSPELIATFIEVVDRICEEREKEQITKTLFHPAAKGDPHARALLEEIKKQCKLTSSSFHWIVEMDSEDLVFLSEQPGFGPLFENDPGYTMKIFEKAVLLGNLTVARAGLLHLAKTDPDNCLRAIYFLNTACTTSDEFVNLAPSLEALVRVLDLHPSFKTKKSIDLLIRDGLGVVSRYLHSEGRDLVVDPLFSSLQKMHRLVALYTLENPLWPLLWMRVERMDKNKGIHDWIDLRDLETTMGEIASNRALLELIRCFKIDGHFVYELARVAKKLSQENPIRFSYEIIYAISKAFDSLIAGAPKEPLPEAKEVVLFVTSIFKLIPGKTTKEAIDQRIRCTFFLAAYGEPSDELLVLEFFDEICKQESIDISLTSTAVSRLGIILFLFAKRAIARNDFIRLNQIISIYKARSKEKSCNLACFYEDEGFQCIEVQKALQTLFVDPNKNKRLPHDAPEFAVIGFYSDFLADVLRRYPSNTPSTSPLYTEIIEKTDSHIWEFLRFLTAKKLIRSIPFIEPLICASLRFCRENFLLPFSGRILQMGIAILAEMEKHPIHQEDLTPFCALLYTLNQCPFARKTSSDEESAFSKDLMLLLEKARSILSCFTGNFELVKNTCFQLGLLQTLLNKREIRSYHFLWAESILKRKNVVSIGEISQWILLTKKLDRVNARTVWKGIFIESYHDKFFISGEYFTEPGVLENFLGIIDLGFKKFYEDPTDITKIDCTSEINVANLVVCDFFTLIHHYHHHIRNAINALDSKAPKKAIALRKIFFTNILTYLKWPKEKCDGAPLAALVGSLGGLIKGELRYEIPKGYILDEVIVMFYWVAHNIRISSHCPILIIIEFLKSTYEYEKKHFHRVLSSEQIREFQGVLEEFQAVLEYVPEEEIAAGSAGGVGCSSTESLSK